MIISSIIVPIYNCEKYLSRCIDSILDQTFTDFELILVNDGSKDNSGMICDDYAQKDSRIVVIHKENGGVSSARNMGLRIASGKYISFVDADDTIDKQFLSTLIDENIDVDLIICGFTEIDSYSNVATNNLYNIPSEQIFNFSEIKTHIISSTYTSSNLTNSCWNKLYKKSIIDDHNLTFVNRKRGEDWLFNIEYLQVINSAIYHNLPLYKYHRNNTSAMSNLLENQISLWIENRIIRQDLIDKYELSINEKLYNTVWIKKVLQYIYELYYFSNPNKVIITKKIINNGEFILALNNTELVGLNNKVLVFFLKLKSFILIRSYLCVICFIRKLFKR